VTGLEAQPTTSVPHPQWQLFHVKQSLAGLGEPDKVGTGGNGQSILGLLSAKARQGVTFPWLSFWQFPHE
jgi:hypothetical protein